LRSYLILLAITYTSGVILSAAVFQAERRACPERSRRNLARGAAQWI